MFIARNLPEVGAGSCVTGHTQSYLHIDPSWVKGREDAGLWENVLSGLEQGTDIGTITPVLEKMVSVSSGGMGKLAHFGIKFAHFRYCMLRTVGRGFAQEVRTLSSEAPSL